MRPFETSNVIAKSILIPSVLGRSATQLTVMTLYSASDMPDYVCVLASGTVDANYLIYCVKRCDGYEELAKLMRLSVED